MSGHLFIINGDLTKIGCDAVLIPTSFGFGMETWKGALTTEQRDEVAQLRTNPGKSWGRNGVIPMKRIPNRPRLWLGNIGQVGDSSDFSVFEPFVEEFVSKAAKDIRSRTDAGRIYDWPLPRLAINVVGSGRGGARKKKGELVDGLVRSLRRLVGLFRVDIILVTYGDKPYAAAQRARLQHIGVDDQAIEENWAFENEPAGGLIEKARKLAQNAIDNHLVLFIGAGASKGAGLKLWPELLEDVATEAGIQSMDRFKDKDLRDQATILEHRLRLQHKDLRREVADRLDSNWYSLVHGLLASLPSSEAVTTNYDDLFEAAWGTAGRSLAVLPEHPARARGRWLLKLHGSVGKSDNIILTRADYLNMPRQYRALMGLVQGLLMMRHLMFVGYSLQDEDFHELIQEVRSARGGHSLKDLPGTVLSLHEDPLDTELWRQDLDIVAMTREANTSADGDRATRKAARQLEMFLDLVGYLSTTSAAFFLDPTYNALSEDEKDLRELLTKVALRTKGAKRGRVAYKVRQFLRQELGAN